jgi:hypothetical protein
MSDIAAEKRERISEGGTKFSVFMGEVVSSGKGGETAGGLLGAGAGIEG